MNLIEAIKSGRKFRCKSSTGDFGKFWWRASAERGFEAQDSPLGRVDRSLTVSEVVADDWEVEEAAVTITREQFWDAVERTSLECGNKAKEFDLEALARNLGLPLGEKPTPKLTSEMESPSRHWTGSEM